MHQRKIYHLLSIFDEGALSGFREFLSSPYLNHSQTLIHFFDLWVEKVLKDEKGKEDLSVDAFLAGSGIQPYRMDKLCSQLYTKAKMFLSYEEFAQRSVLQEKLLQEIESAKKKAIIIKQLIPKILLQFFPL